MPSTEAIFRYAEEIVNLGYRRSGTESGYRAAAYMKCQFEAIGLEDVQYETATTWKWESDRHELHVGGEPVDSFPIAHSFITPGEPSRFSTGDDGIETEIVDVGGAGALSFATRDVEGKLVLFDLSFILANSGLLAFGEYVYDPGLTMIDPLDTLFAANPYITNITSAVEAAIDAGAVGVVGVLSDYFDSNKYYNEFYRDLGMTIPGVWVTATEGERIRAMMDAAEEPLTARLVMSGSREEVEARTVVGFLPGNSAETIQVQSHHDSVFDGAVEERLHRQAMEGATHPASPNSPLRSDLPPEFVPEYRTAGNPFVPEAQGGAMRNPFGPIPGALQAASDPAVDPARAAVKQRILQALQLSEKKARKGGNRTATGRESPSGGAELLPHQSTFNWLVREEQVDAIMDGMTSPDLMERVDSQLRV